MTRPVSADLVHCLTAMPLINRYVQTQDPQLKPLYDEFLRLSKLYWSPVELLYQIYCEHAHEPEQRDYNLLRQCLAENVKQGCELIRTQIDQLISPKDRESIHHVFDIGAGHDEYAKILASLFPHAKITLVDKHLVQSTNFKQEQCNAIEFIQHHGDCDRCLFFMSEFLHCKENLVEILDHKNIQSSHVLIHELMPNPFIDYRLRQTGGGLLTIDEIATHFLKANSTNQPYKNFFDYYFFYARPHDAR